jgi:hypothetical protein
MLRVSERLATSRWEVQRTRIARFESSTTQFGLLSRQPSINDIVTESTIGTWTGEKDGEPVVYHIDDADADESKMMGHLQRADNFYSAIRRLVSLLTHFPSIQWKNVYW